MIMQKGQVYLCQNPRCGAELEVERQSTSGFSNPICCCGSEMTKQYDTPALRKIESSPEVMALLKLLAEIHGLELVDKTANPDRAGAADLAKAPEPQFEPVRLPCQSPAEAPFALSLERVRYLHTQRVLEMCHGNRARAAQVLGIGRTSLYRILKRITESEESMKETQVQNNGALLKLLSHQR